MRCPRSGFASHAVIVFASLVFLFAATTTAAQQVKSETYLMQLAAAVSGYSGGQAVWVVICGSTDPYEILGAFTSERDAREALSAAMASGRQCSVEGPFKTGETYAGGVKTYGSGCKKAPDSSCQSDTSRATIMAFNDVIAVSVTYMRRTGPPVVDRFSPRDVEAIFFTMAAADRLLIPYLTRLRGVEYARAQRQNLACRFRVGMMAAADTTSCRAR
jgi:hypothetical protein